MISSTSEFIDPDSQLMTPKSYINIINAMEAVCTNNDETPNKDNNKYHCIDSKYTVTIQTKNNNTDNNIIKFSRRIDIPSLVPVNDIISYSQISDIHFHQNNCKPFNNEILLNSCLLIQIMNN